MAKNSLPAGGVADVNPQPSWPAAYRRSNNEHRLRGVHNCHYAVIADAFKAVEVVAGFRIDFVKLTLDRQAAAVAEQDRELASNHAVALWL